MVGNSRGQPSRGDAAIPTSPVNFALGDLPQLEDRFDNRVGHCQLGNLLAVSPPRTIANLLICGPGVDRERLKNRKGLPQLDNALRNAKFSMATD